jgi:flagellar hook-associated protein 3 FlgL
MRITDNMRLNANVSYLFNTQSRYNDLMEKIVTQKKVNRASDDPIVATKIIDIRQGIAANEQYLKNITDSNTWISITESTLSGAYDLLGKAKEIAVGQAMGTDEESRKISSELVQSIIDAMAGLANTKFGDRYLFSGSKNGTAPFSATHEDASIETVEQAGNNVFEGTAVSSGTYTGTTNKTYAVKITGEGPLATATAQISTDGGRTWNDKTEDGTDLSVAGAIAGGVINLADGVVLTFNDDSGAETFGENDIFVVSATAAGFYRGNNDPLSVTINRGISVAYNITGAEAFTTGSDGAGVDVFKTLNDLKDALDNNDVEEISHQLENLQNAQVQVLLNQSLCGITANHIEIAKNSLDSLDLKLTSLLSDAQDADLAEYATKLSMQEIALQTSYAMAAKLGNMTILNFLK